MTIQRKSSPGKYTRTEFDTFPKKTHTYTHTTFSAMDSASSLRHQVIQTGAPKPSSIFCHEGFPGLPDSAWEQIPFNELCNLASGEVVHYVRDAFLSSSERKKLQKSCVDEGKNYQDELIKYPKKRKKIRCMIDCKADSTSVRVRSITRKFKDTTRIKLSDVKSHNWVLRDTLKGNPTFYIRIKKTKQPPSSTISEVEEMNVGDDPTPSLSPEGVDFSCFLTRGQKEEDDNIKGKAKKKRKMEDKVKGE